MELVMCLERGEDCRLRGTVRLAHEPRGRRFSGTLELLGALEELVPRNPAGDRPEGIPMTGEEDEHDR